MTTSEPSPSPDFSNLFDLHGRTALVTGGSRGIGRMIAAGLLAQGARVYITARKADACDAAARELSAWGECISLPADVSSVAGIDALVQEFTSREPSLDILVNNAGAAWAAPLTEFPESGWDKVMDLNVKSVFFLTQRLLPALTARRTDRPAKVINIASIEGLSVSRELTYSYQASKAAVVHLTRRLSVELVKHGVVVNGIAPGAFPSQMYREARDNPEAASVNIPAGRVGREEDMAGAAIYLASRAGDYVVGSTLVVDGGLSHTR